MKRLLLKTVFFMAILLMLVLMGMHNRMPVDFTLPPIVATPIRQPAALMYFTFFAIGVLTGTIISAGPAKKSASKGKSDK
jgi:uncharacterized integral membrane protein